MIRGRLGVAAVCALAACAAPEGPERVAEGGDVCREIAALYAVAQRASFALDHAEAERRLRAILARGAAAEDCPDGVSSAVAQAELGLALSSQRKFRLGDLAFAEADAALARRGTAAGAVERARVDALRAQHALNRRRYDEARAASEAALAALAPAAEAGIADLGDLFDLGAEDRARRLSGLSSLYARSAALARGGDPEAARGAIAQAIEIAAATPGAAEAVSSRLLAERALVELLAGRPEAAVEPAGRAADQLADALPDTPLAARARLIEASALAALGRRDAAFAAFDAAFDAYAENPAELLYESVWPYLKLAIEAEAAGAVDSATLADGVFRAAQLVRSASAAEDIAAGAALLESGGGAAGEAVRAWKSARDELFLLSTALARRDLPEFEREALNARFVAASEEEARLRARRDAAAPAYARAVERPVALAEVRAALAPGEALVQILVGRPRTTLILVRPESAVVRTSRIDGETMGAITRILRGAVRAGPDGLYPGFNVEGAHLVFEQLFGDLAPEIAAQERLFAVVSGPLQALPLELLVVDDPASAGAGLERGDYREVAWLGARSRISYLPSARSLVDLRALPPSRATARAIAFGAYDPGPDGAAAIDPRRSEACAPEVALIRRLPPLPGTRAELARIAEGLGPDGVEIVSGADFTEAAVKRLSGSGRLADHRIVHFATHGLLWPSEDCFDPALTATVAPGSGEDGLLESGEIRALSLDAQLAVLSACESTDVEIAEAGENLSGLARALFRAGARTVMATHWQVEDEAAAELMGAFYARLGEDESTSFAEALGAAQAALRGRAETSHPAFWAPFVLVGDGGLALSGRGADASPLRRRDGAG